MPRFKDSNINLPAGSRSPTTGGLLRDWESIQTGILLDIRDELKELNNVLRSQRDLTARIDRRLAKHLPLKKVP